MIVLLKRELNNFFNSLLGYIAIIVFLVINSLFLFVFPLNYNIFETGYANLDGLFFLGPFVFLFLIPAITMRFFADEKRTGTIELLLTKPLTDTRIILSKYLAGLILVLFSLLPTLVYFFTVYEFGLPPGNIDTGATWGSYIGLFLIGAAFVAIGTFASTITENQIVSFILATFFCAFIYIGFELIYSLEFFGQLDFFIKNLGIYTHYNSMSRGVIDSRDLLYFLSLIVFFLLLTKIALESRKW